MKKTFVLVLLFVATMTMAQNKNTKASIEVDGVCMMCKNRIEKACITTKGVKSANWNVETHELQLIYDERKTDLETIQANIAAVGHDTPAIKATKKVYDELHGCCKYRDEEIIEEHKKE